MKLNGVKEKAQGRGYGYFLLLILRFLSGNLFRRQLSEQFNNPLDFIFSWRRAGGEICCLTFNLRQDPYILGMFKVRNCLWLR